MTNLINELVSYAIARGLAYPDDYTYLVNRLASKLNVDVEEMSFINETREIHEIMNDLEEEAIKAHLIEDLSYAKDIFDAEIMNIFIDKPSTIVCNFNNLYNEEGPIAATDWFYQFSKDVYYIKEHAISKNIFFEREIADHDIQITINLSKPEKDPKSIALALEEKTTYPKCALCRENEGFKGSASKAARANHRIIPQFINGQRWYLQYSPYSYYTEHAILLSATHKNMCINDDTIKNLIGFVDKYNHYFIGSNADLPIVGGSILTHEHYQAGHYIMPIQKAKARKDFLVDGVKVSWLNWPLTTLRIKSDKAIEVINTVNKVLHAWRKYEDKKAGIINSTQDLHNTITPIVRWTDTYEADIILRNNITSEEHPDGVFHAHKEYHSIKKENIGLIEAMGLAILPGRLATELIEVAEYLLSGEGYERVSKHEYFIKRFKEAYPSFTEADIMDKIQTLVATFFYEILENCGVYKLNEEGEEGITNFINSLED